MDEAASLPEQAPPDHAPKAPCPMMQGAQCLSLCAAAPPAVGVTAPFERADDSHPWSYEAASTPHLIAPPHRPPKTLCCPPSPRRLRPQQPHTALRPPAPSAHLHNPTTRVTS